jgi:predicted permease
MRRVAKEECGLTQATTSADTSRNNLLMVAAGGVISGVLTPLLPALINHIVGLSGQLRISLIAVPFAVLVFILVRRFSANPALGSDTCCHRHHDRVRLRG